MVIKKDGYKHGWLLAQVLRHQRGLYLSHEKVFAHTESRDSWLSIGAKKHFRVINMDHAGDVKSRRNTQNATTCTPKTQNFAFW